jgi:hypothetical protein
MDGPARQEEIYLAGLRGKKPAAPVGARALEERARKKMSRRGFAYIAGGAGGESTMAANRASFERWRIVPRMLHDVSSRDLSVELFGRTLPAPFLLAPIGALEMAHRDADLAVARAAAAEGIPAIFESGLRADGDLRGRDGRCAAVVPALLEYVGRPRRELRSTRGSVPLRGDRRDTRHDDVRVASA